MFPASFLLYPGAVTSNWEVTGLRERGDGKSFHLPFPSIAAVLLHHLLLVFSESHCIVQGKEKVDAVGSKLQYKNTINAGYTTD